MWTFLEKLSTEKTEKYTTRLRLHLFFLGSQLYKYKFFLSLILSFIKFYIFSQAYIVPTTRGHHTIILHTTPFEHTFRDYCGINLLLGHQYGSHYLYLNLKNTIKLYSKSLPLNIVNDKQQTFCKRQQQQQFEKEKLK